MAYEMGLEEDYWERPKSLMHYSDFIPLKEDIPYWERRLNQCESLMQKRFLSE